MTKNEGATINGIIFSLYFWGPSFWPSIILTQKHAISDTFFDIISTFHNYNGHDWTKEKDLIEFDWEMSSGGGVD